MSWPVLTHSKPREGRPPVFRESGQFFQFWRLIDGQWLLPRVYSLDHRPAH